MTMHMKRRGRPSLKLDRAREIIRAGGTNARKLAEQHGISHVTFEAAQAVEAALTELEVDPATLSNTAQARFETVRKQAERRAGMENAARVAQLDEEVRQRVLAQSKEHVARLEAMEAEARETQRYYETLINRHKPPFTAAEFTTILRCLHPDSRNSITAETLGEAFRLFQARKIQLSGGKG
jgi:hypothetical protein